MALLLTAVLVFHQFVLGEKLLLYKDIGSDSLNIFYPYFVHISDYVRSTGLPSWSFFVGMGQSIYFFSGYLILQPIVWLPRDAIPSALVFQHLIKVIVSGLLFLRFLQLRGVGCRASFMGSLLLCFSAYMSMGSCWYGLADEVLCFTFLLFGVEKAIQDGRWIYLSLAGALASLFLIFHLYLSALVLCLYVPARFIELHGWRPHPLFGTCARLAAAVFLGIGLGTFVWLEGSLSILNSPRGSGLASAANTLFNWPVFRFESIQHYITAALRPFSNDLLGGGDSFAGWQNYFEAPLTYCGLITLLLLPQAFVRATTRRRLLFGLFLALVLLPTIFPWFRYLFWLFQGDYYRTFSLFAIFGLITLSVTAFSRYVSGGDLNLPLLGITAVVLVGILYLPIAEMQAIIDTKLRSLATILLIAYAILLTVGQLLRRQRMLSWFVIGLLLGELVYFSQTTVADRRTLTKQELKERTGYNDYTVDALRDIGARESTPFFRLSKMWASSPVSYPTLNDALVFGYYGTASYSSFNNLNYISFLAAVDVISASDASFGTKWSQTKYSSGLLGHPLLSTFACEKYVLTREPVPFQMSEDYELIKRYGNDYLFENKQSLPFGLSYDQFVTDDAFRQLSPEEKPLALLQAVVLSEQDAVKSEGISRWDASELRSAIRRISPREAIMYRRAETFRIRSFSQTRIDGSMHLDKKGLLLFQMPFDAGWRALVNGEPAPTLKVDVGLLGVLLPSGENAVELQYRPIFLYPGLALTLISFVIFGLALWRWPRISRPS